MRGKHIKREGDTIVRLFSVSDLLDEPSAIRSRVEIINALPFNEFETSSDLPDMVVRHGSGISTRLCPTRKTQITR